MPNQDQGEGDRGASAPPASEGVEKTRDEVEQARKEGESAARRVLNEEKDDD